MPQIWATSKEIMDVALCFDGESVNRFRLVFNCSVDFREVILNRVKDLIVRGFKSELYSKFILRPIADIEFLEYCLIHHLFYRITGVAVCLAAVFHDIQHHIKICSYLLKGYIVHIDFMVNGCEFFRNFLLLRLHKIKRDCVAVVCFKQFLPLGLFFESIVESVDELLTSGGIRHHPDGDRKHLMLTLFNTGAEILMIAFAFVYHDGSPLPLAD